MSKLFPTRVSLIIFITYMTLFVNQSLLVTASRRGKDDYNYNTILVVLITEIVKLIICLILYLRTSIINNSTFGLFKTMRQLYRDVRANYYIAILYIVPSLLYCFYNNLTFVNLKAFDPTSYNCLMQFRIVLTAIIYQTLFQRKLNRLQWASLLVLTFGCVLKQYGIVNLSTGTHSNHNITHDGSSNGNLFVTTATPTGNRLENADQTTISPTLTTSASNGLSFAIFFNFSLVSLLFQIFCSCFAGVYNEYLLKGTGKDVDIVIQNIFMYFDSIICNIVIYLLNTLRSLENHSDINSLIEFNTPIETTWNTLVSPMTIAIILNNALSGIITSFFLKNLNSILKTYASAFELFAIAILAWMIFGINIDSYTIIAIIFVSIAIMMYSQNPVSVAPPSSLTNSNSKDLPHSEGFLMIPTEEPSDDEIEIYSRT